MLIIFCAFFMFYFQPLGCCCHTCLLSLFTPLYLQWPEHYATLARQTRPPTTTRERNESSDVRGRMSTERSACSLKHQTRGSRLLLSYWAAPRRHSNYRLRWFTQMNRAAGIALTGLESHVYSWISGSVGHKQEERRETTTRSPSVWLALARLVVFVLPALALQINGSSGVGQLIITRAHAQMHIAQRFISTR